jgi:gliding motility-associated protein GldL
MGLFSFTETRGYKYFMAKIYGIGAAIVLIGALFKINHYPYADIMLIVGLGTEAIIFFLSAFEPPHIEYDWSLVHPEFAGMYGKSDGSELKKRKSPTERLDEMLEKAQIDQAAIEKLGSGMERLSENALQLNNVTDAAVVSEEFYTNMKAASGSASELHYAFGKEVEATNQYSDNMNKVNEGAESLATAYEKATEVMNTDINTSEVFTSTVQAATNSAQSLADSYEKSAEILSNSVAALDFTAVEGDAYNVQLRKIAENLSALNAIYEVQLQGTTKTVESSEQLHVTMNEFLSKIEASTASTAEFSGQMDSLTERMSSLNKVYGNMLSAMNANV